MPVTRDIKYNASMMSSRNVHQTSSSPASELGVQAEVKCVPVVLMCAVEATAVWVQIQYFCSMRTVFLLQCWIACLLWYKALSAQSVGWQTGL